MAKLDNTYRQAVAVTLYDELGMSNSQVGRYMGLHATTVCKLRLHGETSPRNIRKAS